MTKVDVPPATELADAVRQSARSGAPDRYLAALLAPRANRTDLVTLAAFSAEIEKIAGQVHEPSLGEIRLQWWRDALDPAQHGDKTGHPVADALIDLIARHGLASATFDGYFDAHSHRLYGSAPESEQALSLEIDLIEGTLFSVAAQILSREPPARHGSLISDAAQAYGAARLGLDLPYALSRGRIPLPTSVLKPPKNPDWRVAMDALIGKSRAHLAHVRSAYSSSPRALKTALLPAALVEPYLRVLSRSGRDPTRDIADVTPLTRTWYLAKSHVCGRI